MSGSEVLIADHPLYKVPLERQRAELPYVHHSHQQINWNYHSVKVGLAADPMILNRPSRDRQ